MPKKRKPRRYSGGGNVAPKEGDNVVPKKETQEELMASLLNVRGPRPTKPSIRSPNAQAVIPRKKTPLTRKKPVPVASQRMEEVPTPQAKFWRGGSVKPIGRARPRSR